MFDLRSDIDPHGGLDSLPHRRSSRAGDGGEGLPDRPVLALLRCGPAHSDEDEDEDEHEDDDN